MRELLASFLFSQPPKIFPAVMNLILKLKILKGHEILTNYFTEKQVSQNTHCVSRTVVHDQLTGSSQPPEGTNYNCSILEIQKPLHKS